MARELDRLQRDMDKWRTKDSDMQSQLVEARALLRVASVMQGAGFDVVCMCTDGESTYGANAGHAYTHVQDPEKYDFHLAIRKQAGVRSGMCVPGMTVVHCFDIDRQGKNSRYALAKGHALVVFAPFAVGRRGISVDRDTLLSYGAAAPCFSDAAAGKMEDVLAAKLFSGKHCLPLRDRLDAALEGVAQFYQQVSQDNDVIHGTLRPTSSFSLPWIRLPGPTAVCCYGSAGIRPSTGNCRAPIA
jgi:hypothetical protein